MKKKKITVRDLKTSKTSSGSIKHTLPKYGLGGDIFGGAASGAAAGSVAGPWGTAAGAVVGAVGGIFGNKKKKRLAAQQKELAAKNQRTQLAYADYINEQPNQQYMTMFKNGGKVKGKPTKKIKTGGMRFNSEDELLDYYESIGAGNPTLYYPNKKISAGRDKEGKMKYVQSSDEEFKGLMDWGKTRNLPKGGLKRETLLEEPAKMRRGGKVKPPVKRSGKLRRGYEINPYSGKIVKEGSMDYQPLLQADADSLARRTASFYDPVRPGKKPKGTANPYSGYVGGAGIDPVTRPLTITDDEYLQRSRTGNTKFAMGGNVPLSDVELEGGESGVTPSGDDFNVNGPSHEQGGVPMQLPPDTDVFSDRIKQPGTNKTYSDLNKKISKKTDKYDKTLEDPASTGISRKTAERMLGKLKGEQRDLFIDQERLKLQKGGFDSKYKMFAGGDVPMTMDRIGQQRLNSFNSSNVGLKQSTSPANDYADSSTWAGDALRSVGGALNSGSGIAGNVAQVAPALYNIGQGLFGKTETLDPSDYENVQGQAALSGMKNRKFDISPQLDSIRRANAIGKRNVASGANTRGELLTGYGALNANRVSQESAAYAQKSNMDNQYYGEYARMASDLGARSASNRLNIEDINARRKAARTQYLQTGLSQFSGILQQGKKQAGLERSDDLRYNALRRMYPYQNFN